MSISENFQVDKKIADGSTVKKIRPSPREIRADIPYSITDLIEVELDPLYENVAFLAFATFKEKVPPPEEWKGIALGGTEKIRQFWKPQKIKQECICVDYNKRAQSNHVTAVSHIIAAKKNVLVSAQLVWFGFPFVNRFFVGFKPGMRERTEELLMAGLDFV